MARLLGVVVMVLMMYGLLMGSNEDNMTVSNHKRIAAQVGYYGILTVGVGILIISGGIDLSIGSVVALGAVVFAWLLGRRWDPWAAAGVVLLGGALIGLVNGLLVTLVRLQPFLVTLCGLFIYRGLARVIANGRDLGTSAVRDRVQPMADLLVNEATWSEFVLLLLIAAVLGLLLHGTKYGRYLFAIGANEEAARYAGIRTGRYKILPYVICSTLAGLGGVLFLLEYSNVNTTTAGNLFELYAITGAVLGGCSLRGGEGNIAGMVLGAAAIPLLQSLCQSLGNVDNWKYVVIGTALLVGTITDELLRRLALRRA